MSGLVRYDVDVGGRSVEVCEDERLVILIETRHISARPFAFAREHVERVGIHHHIHKRAGFGTHILVHFLPCFQNAALVESGFRIFLKIRVVVV